MGATCTTGSSTASDVAVAVEARQVKLPAQHRERARQRDGALVVGANDLAAARTSCCISTCMSMAVAVAVAGYRDGRAAAGDGESSSAASC